MSAALDDIWDEPAIPSNTVTRRQLPVEDDDEDQEALPVKRRRATQPLFYDSDSDREAGPSKKASASKSKSKSGADEDLDDLDAHFDGLDGDDDRPRTPVGNRADAHRSSSPLHAITSSSPTREDGAGRWKDDAGGEKGDGKEKKKRPLPKMDETRLLSEVGFPALIKKTKGFVPKGKGHEQADLNRLLQVYQFWAHEMYPKTRFSDTVKTVEKLCHSKRMHVALSVWRDEAHGLVNGQLPVPADDDVELGSDNEALPRDIPVASSRENSPESAPVPGHRAEPGPPTSGSEMEDEWDMDAAIADEEEMEKQNATTSSRPAATANYGDEDDDFWADLATGTGTTASTTRTTISAPAASSSTAPAAQTTTLDEDDIWAQLDEAMMDVDEAAAASSTKPPPAASKTPASAATVEDDWDDMYIS